MTWLVVVTSVIVILITIAIVREPAGRTWDPTQCAGLPMPGSTTRPPSALAVVGQSARAALRQPVDPSLDRAAGRALAFIVAVGIVHVGLAIMATFGLWARSMARRRRNTRTAEEKVSAGLADVIDLFAVALLSGNTVAEASHQICEWSEGDFADAFAWCNRRVAAGLALGDALETLPSRLGPQTRPLIAALVSTERYGAPIALNLAQLAAETRSDRRRRAEASARRLPVALLFPLVVCVLPAFLLVTVVPVVIETMSQLDVAASP